MKLSAREDIEAPVAEVFAVLADVDMFERMALRRGAEVVREAGAARPTWRIAFPFRGKRRELTVWQQGVEAPRRLDFAGRGVLIEGAVRVDLIELGPRRTRMTLETEIRPLTLAARLFLQSLKLARSRVTRRYQASVAALAAVVAARTQVARQAGDRTGPRG
jgi:carbon monoxide dehydrogenase subunit G